MTATMFCDTLARCAGMQENGEQLDSGGCEVA